MAEGELRYYILFANYEHGLALRDLLLKDGTFYWKTLGGEIYRTAPMFG